MNLLANESVLREQQGEPPLLREVLERSSLHGELADVEVLQRDEEPV